MRNAINNITAKYTSWLQQPMSPDPLGAFRIGIGLFSIIQILLLYPNLLQIYGEYGFIQWTFSDIMIGKWVPKVSDFVRSMEWFNIGHDASVYLLFYVYLVSLIGLVCGFKSRICGGIAFLVHLMLAATSQFTIYGAELFTNIALFYCFVLPVGHAYSLDNILKGKRRNFSIRYSYALRLLQLHLAVVYVSSGIDKMKGIQWWNGEAIWRSVMMPQLNQFDMSWLADHVYVAKMLGWSVLVLEVLYAIFIWKYKTRKYWLLFVILMHVGIGVFLGLWLFALIMVVLNITIFGWELIDQKYLRSSFDLKRYFSLSIRHKIFKAQSATIRSLLSIDKDR